MCDNEKAILIFNEAVALYGILWQDKTDSLTRQGSFDPRESKVSDRSIEDNWLPKTYWKIDHELGGF